MIIWIMLGVLLNGVIAFAYSAGTANLWAMLAVTFVYFLGVTQIGVVFSAVMRIARSEWARHFTALGEVITLSFIPVAAVTFLVIYIGGMDHLFFWASAHHGEHVNPWFGRSIFLWKNLVFMALFYVSSYAYFRASRDEGHQADRPGSRTRVFATLVIISYVILNTNIAWDFGMTLIPHWDSSIFPPYFWSGNLLAGSASLFLVSVYLQPEGIRERHLDSMGKVLLGFMLLWVYMFWSQYIVIWYGNQPDLAPQLYKKMSGNFEGIFGAMILLGLIIPFFGLIFRRIKLQTRALSGIAASICAAIWIDRYLMIIPAFTDGSARVFATWAGISLTLAGIASVVLSVIVFLKFFPSVKIRAGE